MTIDRTTLEEYINELASLRECIRQEFLRAGNPGLPAVFQELQLAVRALEDAKTLLDGLTVKG